MPSIPQSLLWISLVVLWLFVLVRCWSASATPCGAQRCRLGDPRAQQRCGRKADQARVTGSRAL